MMNDKSAKRPSPQRKAFKMKWLAWLGGGGLVLLLAGFLIWKHHFHDYTPLDALLDLRAAAHLGHSPDPVGEFLERRYGPQTDPANREKAFVDFFNAGHIEGLYLIVGNRSDPQTKKLVAKVAQTITDYRALMTPDEKADLGAYFRSDAGRAQVHEAKATFQSKDVRFRSVTTPVIKEILGTLADVNGF
jgi:hypothetical protein